MTDKVILDVKPNEDLRLRWHQLGNAARLNSWLFESPGYKLMIEDYLHLDIGIHNLIKELQQLRKDTADHILQDNHTKKEISHGKD
jgi:hypothetical protein